MALLLVISFSHSLATDVHVAPHGSDTHPGTAALPLATLERARSLAAPGSTIHCHSGTYRLQRALTLGFADSNVSWIGANATISGGVALTGKWQPSKFGANILQYNLSSIRGRQSRHLCVNCQRAERKRMSEGGAGALFSGATMTDDDCWPT